MDKMLSKKEIRANILRLRNSLSSDEINTKSSVIQNNLQQLIEERDPESIMFYMSFGNEIQTSKCISWALKIGKIVIVPVCITENSAKSLLPSQLINPELEIAPGTFGVLEPKPEFRRPFPPELIDIVVVPGIAFDEKGYRIGYGAGYYDKFLPKCPKALFVALAYELQIVNNIFPSEWDVPVHKIITENRIISVK